MTNAASINSEAVNGAASGVTGMLTGSVLLNTAQGIAFTDFTAGLTGDELERYVMDLDSGAIITRVPMSSWQATLKTETSNYIQCVIPAVADWIDTITAATSFTIYKQVETGGIVLEYEMATSPLDIINYSKGPDKYTAVISGYSDGFASSLDPPAEFDRTLTGVRSISSGAGGIRVRCKIDFLLRPGHRAIVDGTSFIVSFINYYSLESDAYMDAGE